MNIMKSTAPDHAHCTICSLWVDTTPFQDPAVSWHAHGPCLMVFFEVLVCRDGFRSLLDHSVVRSNPKWGFRRQSRCDLNVQNTSTHHVWIVTGYDT
jgi:hypothetical protein